MNLDELLLEGSSELGVMLDSGQIQQFQSYRELIKKWNNKINLTSVTDDGGITVKHFLDSLTVSEFIADSSDILDIGTGAGFPGIPLAIARESLNITVIDSRGKRIFFINEVIRELGLKNVKTFAVRAEDDNNNVPKNYFDFVLTRAVGDIEEVLYLSTPYIKDDGKIILMRGKEGKREWENSENNIYKLENIKELELPGTDFMRALLVLTQK